eukprot:s1404_g7.t1
MVSMPDLFTAVGAEAEQTAWPDFGTADPGFEIDLEGIAEHVDTEFDMNDKSLHDHIQGLDRLVAEYRKASGLTLLDEESLSVLIRCLPANIRQHIQLSLDQTATYSTVRSRALGFETVTNIGTPLSLWWFFKFSLS